MFACWNASFKFPNTNADINALRCSSSTDASWNYIFKNAKCHALNLGNLAAVFDIVYLPELFHQKTNLYLIRIVI